MVMPYRDFNCQVSISNEHLCGVVAFITVAGIYHVTAMRNARQHDEDFSDPGKSAPIIFQQSGPEYVGRFRSRGKLRLQLHPFFGILDKLRKLLLPTHGNFTVLRYHLFRLRILFGSMVSDRPNK